MIAARVPAIHNLQVYFGPPGTGKTTTLSRLVRQYAEAEGEDTLLLCSLTRAAAHELAGRDLPLPEHAIGTLHSHCYHGLDRPTIAESKYKDWNKAHPQYPLSASQSHIGIAPDEGHQHKLMGDQLLAAYNLARTCLRPVHEGAVQYFVRVWEDWKQQYGYLDFTDLLVEALKVLRVAPGRPHTIVVDEAQDLTPLQWALIAQWSQHASRTIAAGDDDQTLYRWCGADPGPLLAADETTKHILPRSYRLPQAVYDHSLTYLQEIKIRQPKTWAPRDVSGICKRTPVQWGNPGSFVGQLLEALDEPWGTFAVITTCAYMLDPLIDYLAAEGIPFANPWRRIRRDWNPLSPPQRGIGAVTRLLDFLRPPDRLWTWRELATWVPLLRNRGNLTSEAKTTLTLHAEEDRVCTRQELASIFLPDVVDGALQGGMPWLTQRLLANKAKSMAYPVRVYRRYGREALLASPRIHLGTCHSLKGAEADQVLLFTDLSRAAQLAQLEGGDTADDVQRTLYVGATRAKEHLYVA